MSCSVRTLQNGMTLRKPTGQFFLYYKKECELDSNITQGNNFSGLECDMPWVVADLLRLSGRKPCAQLRPQN